MVAAGASPRLRLTKDPNTFVRPILLRKSLLVAWRDLCSVGAPDLSRSLMQSQDVKQVVGRDGFRGQVLSPSSIDPADHIEIELNDGSRLHVPNQLLVLQPDGTYTISLSLHDLPSAIA